MSAAIALAAPLLVDHCVTATFGTKVARNPEMAQAGRIGAIS